MVPHPEVALDRLLICHQQIVVRGNAAARVHVFQRLEFRQCRVRHVVGVPDQLQHLLLPLRIQRFPILVVVEGAFLELYGAARDLLRIGNGVAADVYPAIDDPVIDTQRGRQTMHPGVGRAQRAVRRFCRDHVECGHGLGKVHGIVEPEFPVVGFGKLNMVWIGRLRLFGSRYDLHRAGQRELPGLSLRFHSTLPTRNSLACNQIRTAACASPHDIPRVLHGHRAPAPLSPVHRAVYAVRPWFSSCHRPLRPTPA